MASFIRTRDKNGKVVEIPIAKAGKSAYEIALKHGFAGTEEEWVEALKGKTGTGITNIEKTATSELIDTYTITFTDNTTTTFTVTNGKDGDDGYTPVKGVDYFTTDEVDAIINEALTRLGMSIIEVSADNVVTVKLPLVEGEYVFKYLMEDGSVIEVGTLDLTEEPVDPDEPDVPTPATYTVTKTPSTGCSISGADTATQGVVYTATVSVNSNYELSSIVVTMGGIDVSSSVVSGNNITINNPTGNITITVTAVEVNVPDEPSLVNLIPTSKDKDGSLYNDGTVSGSEGCIGYRQNTRLSGSTASDKAGTDLECVGFMPVKYGQYVFIDNISDTDGSGTFIFYSETPDDVSGYTRLNGKSFKDIATYNLYKYKEKTFVYDGSLSGFIVDSHTLQVSEDSIKDIAYMRVCASDITNQSAIYVVDDPAEMG